MTFARVCFFIVSFMVICASCEEHETLELITSTANEDAIVYVRAPRANGKIDPSTLELLTSSAASLSTLQPATDSRNTNEAGQNDGLETESLTLELSDSPIVPTTSEVGHDVSTERGRQKSLAYDEEKTPNEDGFQKGNIKEEKEERKLKEAIEADLSPKIDDYESLFEFSGTTDENIFESDDVLEDVPLGTTAPINFDIFSKIGNVSDYKTSIASTSDNKESTATTDKSINIEVVTVDIAYVSTTFSSVTVTTSKAAVEFETSDIPKTTAATFTDLPNNNENTSRSDEKFYESAEYSSEILEYEDMSQEYTTTNSATSETEPLKNKSDSNHNRSNIATNSTETPVKVSEISLDPISLEDETIIGEDTKVLSNLTEDIVSQVDSLYEQASSAKEEEEYDEEDEKEKDEIRKMFGEDYDYIEEKETRRHEEKTVIEDTDIYANIMKVKNDKKARGDKKKKDCFKNSDNESFIVRAILGNRANFSIQIRIEDISFFVPEDVTVHEDTTNMLLNFTWRSTKARFNNSLSLMLTQISNYYLVTGVKLKLMKCDEMTDWIKNEVLIPKRKDKYGQLELAADLDDEVTVLISNINFLKIYYDEAEVSGPSTVDIENELFQMEITVAITAFFTVIVIGGVSIVIYFVIVRRKRRLFDFKNKKICPL